MLLGCEQLVKIALESGHELYWQPVDCESSALTTMPLNHTNIYYCSLITFTVCLCSLCLKVSKSEFYCSKLI